LKNEKKETVTIRGEVIAAALQQHKGMKLMPESVTKTVPALYAQEEVADPLCRVKFFDVCGSWTWYVIEYDPEEKLCFGYVDGFEAELGYFTLIELEQLGARIERDKFFKPTPLSEIKRQTRR
jgi:hypothetical protein